MGILTLDKVNKQTNNKMVWVDYDGRINLNSGTLSQNKSEKIPDITILRTNFQYQFNCC